MAAFVGILTLIVDAMFQTSPVTVAVAQIASTVLAIGLITVLYDAVLRQSFTQELLQLVRVASALRSAGVQDVNDELRLDWQSILDGGSSFHIVLIEPTAWLERGWHHILEAARSRKVTVDICVPRADGASGPAIAQQLKMSLDEYYARVKGAVESISDSWTHADPALYKGSSVNVYSFDGLPSHSLIVADERVVLLTHACFGKVPLEGALAISFDGQPRSYPTNWFISQAKQLADLDPIYSNRVEA